MLKLRQSIYHYLRWRVGSHEEAEDLTHDTFVRLIEHGRLGESMTETSIDALLPYAKRVAKHCLIDRCRRHQATKRGGGCHTVSLDDDLLGEVAIDEVTPVTSAERDELWSAWSHAISRLSEMAQRAGKASLFTQASPALLPGERVEAVAGQSLSPSERVQIHRWRQRLLTEMKAELAA